MFGFQSQPVLVCSGSSLDGDTKGALLLVDESIAGALWAQLCAMGAVAAGEAVWERARVAVGRPSGARELRAAFARGVIGGEAGAKAEELWGAYLGKVVAVGDSVTARGAQIGAWCTYVAFHLSLSSAPLSTCKQKPISQTIPPLCFLFVFYLFPGFFSRRHRQLVRAEPEPAPGRRGALLRHRGRPAGVRERIREGWLLGRGRVAVPSGGDAEARRRGAAARGGGGGGEGGERRRAGGEGSGAAAAHAGAGEGAGGGEQGRDEEGPVRGGVALLRGWLAPARRAPHWRRRGSELAPRWGQCLRRSRLGGDTVAS